MMPRPRTSLAFAAMLVSLLMTNPIPGQTSRAAAHDGATGIVKERHDAMISLGQAMKAWKAILDAGQTPDPAALTVISNQLAAGAGQRMLALFPMDGSGHKTKALPAIWTEWDEFERLSLMLETRALSLAKPGPDIVVLGSEFKAVGQICRECHDRFRKR